MVNNFRKANNIGRILDLKINVQELFKKLPEELKQIVVRMVLTNRGLVGNNDTILSKADPLVWGPKYTEFVNSTTSNVTLLKFKDLLETIVNDEHYDRDEEERFYNNFISTMNAMMPKPRALSAASAPPTNTGVLVGGAGRRRRRGTKRARRGRRRSSRKN